MSEENNVTSVGNESVEQVFTEQSTRNDNSNQGVDNYSSIRNALSGMGGSGSVYETATELQNSHLPDPSIESIQEVNNTEQVSNQNPEKTTQVSSNSSSDSKTTEVNPDGIVFESEITGKIDFGNQEETSENTKDSGEAPVQSYSSFDDLNSTLSSLDENLSVDNLVSELPKLIEAKNKYDNVVGEKANLEKVFENMPEPLFKAIEAWGRQDDWREVINSAPRFDFNKDFKDQNQVSMVNHYYPDKISKEEWEDYNSDSPDDAIKEKINEYKSMAQEKFSLSKAKFDQEKTRFENDSRLVAEKINNSYSKSKESMNSIFEGTSYPVTESFSSQVDEVAKDRNSILSIFFEKDGTFKPDAHQRIAMAMAGRNLVLNQAKALEKRMLTKARAEVIKSTPEESKIQTGDGGVLNGSNQAKQKAKEYAKNVLYTEDNPTYGW